jgi:hypothetical protein
MQVETKMKSKYRNGKQARKNFEETMQKLFRAPKAAKKAASTAKASPKASGK